MDIKNEIKSSVKVATDAATDVVHSLVEKSRMRANANRIKQVIKADTELRNQAYIELGRYLYENMRDGIDEEYEQLCVVVDKTTKRIDKATQKYVDFLNNINDSKIFSDNTDKLKKAIVNNADEISTIIKEASTDVDYKSKDTAENIIDVCDNKDDADNVIKQQQKELSEIIIAADTEKDIIDTDTDSSEIPDESTTQNIIDTDDVKEEILAQDDFVICDIEDEIATQNIAVTDDIEDEIATQDNTVIDDTQEEILAQDNFAVDDDEESPEEFDF